MVCFALRGITQDRIQVYMKDVSDLPKFILVVILAFVVTYFVIRTGNVIKGKLRN